MNLTPMRYKTFTWPHNPETYSIVWQRRTAAFKIPFGRCAMQDLGISYRVLRGEGEFAGADAYDCFRRLARVFYQDGPGLLVHPVWQTDRAYFVSLRLTERPLPDYVRYSFEFWEDGAAASGLTLLSSGSAAAPAAAAPSAACTVRRGDTLWGIAKRYGVGLAELLAANPGIRNPNLIYPGEQVVIP